MAYNGFYPNYQPYGAMNGFNQFYQQQANPIMQQQIQQQQTQQIQQPIQQNGFIPVPSEQDARNYPVAPGNSVTFKDERRPYCYVKTMGFNQLDRPTFEKYRLVKEEDAQKEKEEIESKKELEVEPTIEFAKKEELDKVRYEIESIKKKMKKFEKVVAKDDE